MVEKSEGCGGGWGEFTVVTTLILDVEKRFVYVTPTSYLELLSSFKKILQMKRDEVGGYKHRYQVGLDKISSAELQVSGLQDDLQAMQPVLEKTSKEVEEMMVVIARYSFILIEDIHSQSKKS